MTIQPRAAERLRNDGNLGEKGQYWSSLRSLSVLLLIMLGTATFGLAMSYYLMLGNAVNQGALTFSDQKRELYALLQHCDCDR